MASERPLRLYELMFDSTTKRRLTDAVDLLIDFATLGEYGLEPVGRTRQGCAAPSAPPQTRATHRRSQCTLLEEAGFRGPHRPLAR